MVQPARDMDAPADAFVEEEKQAMQQIRRNQDVLLDGVGASLDRLGHMAVAIGDEIKTQGTVRRRPLPRCLDQGSSGGG